MFNRGHSAAVRFNTIVIVCTVAMAMSGVFRTAWAGQGCTGACCAPPANAMHHPAAQTAAASACNAAAETRCGLQETSMDGFSLLTAAVAHHTGKPGAGDTLYRSAVETLTQIPSPNATPDITASTHLPGPPLYLSIAVLRR
ncbi:MAG: hypothetical protein ABIL58_06840 [Pseudomonadota bacterium]